MCTAACNCPTADAPLTAHHQQQDDQQRGHEHQQGQPDVVPHLGGGGAAGSERRGGGRARPAGGRAGARLQRRAPGAARRRGGMGGGRPQGAGRRGADTAAGGPTRPTLLHAAAGGARAEACRGMPLPPHRSREPGTRCRETPAATGCASMADTTRLWKESTGTGTRGDRTALVAALPRVSSALTNGR